MLFDISYYWDLLGFGEGLNQNIHKSSIDVQLFLSPNSVQAENVWFLCTRVLFITQTFIENA